MSAGKHLNKYEIIGNVGKNEGIRTLDNGSKVCKISVATEEGYYPEGSKEFKSETQWHYLEGWGNVAEKMAKAGKGNVVYAEGSFRTQTGKDEKIYPKMKVFTFKVLCDHGKGQGHTDEQPQSPPKAQEKPQVKTPPAAQIDSGEDIPF